jgi:DNA-binding response OmpR family regulator
MKTDRRERIQRSLRNLAESHVATIELLEEAMALLSDEFSLDPLTFFHRSSTADKKTPQFAIDRSMLSVRFGDRTCFLGDSYPFKFICRLARSANTYVSYQDLIAEVWQGDRREDCTVRSTVKMLRKRLRAAGMKELADAIDGSVRRHYGLKLKNE